ncbi:MgtC/SapB family protein [Priestia filamentosa]|uniref:MgtC/SapB family protein n=1 Tax=Priestia filamentosa TaxID=1402861 RepID=UPI0005890385
MDFVLDILDKIDLETCFQLCLAALIGLVIGIERELKKKPTGVKTLMVISVASALLTIISIKSLGVYSNVPGANIVQDPLRLPAQIVSGIGFLGAGVIFKRGNDAVTGLTTAAVIWGVGAIGIAVGSHFISEAIIATIVFLMGIEVIPWLIKKITRIQLDEKLITIKLTISRERETREVMQIVKANHIKIRHVEILDKKDDEAQIKVIKIRGFIRQNLYVTSISDELSKLDIIKELDIRE